ncbi:hypothetical protein EDB19DRAFT_1832768 [Suillus lakei]|nr:hypothetical protein EDB19DRAFT_1832768 [Suillus lakei]
MCLTQLLGFHLRHVKSNVVVSDLYANGREGERTKARQVRRTVGSIKRAAWRKQISRELAAELRILEVADREQMAGLLTNTLGRMWKDNTRWSVVFELEEPVASGARDQEAIEDLLEREHRGTVQTNKQCIKIIAQNATRVREESMTATSSERMEDLYATPEKGECDFRAK